MKHFYFKDLNSSYDRSYVIFENVKEIEPVHLHDFIEIIYVYNGKIVQKINNKQFVMCRGDLLVIGPNSTHSFEPQPQCTYFNVCFNTSVVGDDTISKIILEDNKEDLFNRIITFSGDYRREIENILQYMLMEQSKRDPHNKEIMDAYLTILITIIKRKRNDNTEVDTKNHWNDFEYFISTNLDSQLTLENLSSRFFYNPSYFSRLFKQKYGIKFVDYVLNIRIEKSKELLLNTDKSIKDIAKETGFSSSSVFCRSFLKLIKMSPKEYRKLNAK